MSTNTVKHRNMLSARTTVALGKALEAVCHTNANGLAVYDKGHDDESVAKEVSAATGAPITTLNVQGLRRQLLDASTFTTWLRPHPQLEPQTTGASTK